MDERIRQEFLPGHSTATPLNLRYRIGKLQQHGLMRGRWLDLGCADGAYTAGLLDFGAMSAVGVDVEADRIAAAKRRWVGRSDLEFHHLSNRALPFPDNSFDGVLMNEVLEHVYDEHEALRAAYRVLKPGGTIVVISPNRYFPFEGHGGHIGSLELNFPVPFVPWLPSKIGQKMMRARNYWPYEFRILLTKAGFKVAEVDFIWPVLEIYKWLPAPLIRGYQKLMPLLGRVPGLRRFGVSAMTIGIRLSGFDDGLK